MPPNLYCCIKEFTEKRGTILCFVTKIMQDITKYSIMVIYHKVLKTTRKTIFLIITLKMVVKTPSFRSQSLLLEQRVI